MNDAASRPSYSIGELIVVPAVITLAVTILRLVGNPLRSDPRFQDLLRRMNFPP